MTRLEEQGFEIRWTQFQWNRPKSVTNNTLRLSPAEVASRRQQYLAQEQKQTLTRLLQGVQCRPCTPCTYRCPIDTHWSCNGGGQRYSSHKELEAHITSSHSAAAWKMWRENSRPELTRRFRDLGGWQAIDAGAKGSGSTF